MTGSATVCCCIDCIDCTAVDSWKKCTNVMTVATVCTEMVLQCHCLLYNVLGSTAIDCCSAFLTVFEVTDRSVSSRLCRKVEQQSIAVLHSTLFSRQCHCSTISVQTVATVITFVHFFQLSSTVQSIQSIQQHTVAEPAITL